MRGAERSNPEPVQLAPSWLTDSEPHSHSALLTGRSEAGLLVCLLACMTCDSTLDSPQGWMMAFWSHLGMRRKTRLQFKFWRLSWRLQCDILCHFLPCPLSLRSCDVQGGFLDLIRQPCLVMYKFAWSWNPPRRMLCYSLDLAINAEFQT